MKNIGGLGPQTFHSGPLTFPLPANGILENRVIDAGPIMAFPAECDCVEGQASSWSVEIAFCVDYQ